MLFVAGQVGVDPATGELAGGDVEMLALHAMDNIGAIFVAAGYTFDEIVEVHVFLADLDDYQVCYEVYAGRFDPHPPTRADVEVSLLPLDAKVEIKLTARQ